PASALDAWRRRFDAHGAAFTDGPARFGEDAITVEDPSGLVIELVGTDRDERTPWVAEGIDPAMAIRGVHAVTLRVRRPGPTVEFLAEALGFEVLAES